jgi:hypothetical protein
LPAPGAAIAAFADVRDHDPVQAEQPTALPVPPLSSGSASSTSAKPPEGSGCLFLSPSTPAVQQDPRISPLTG